MQGRCYAKYVGSLTIFVRALKNRPRRAAARCCAICICAVFAVNFWSTVLVSNASETRAIFRDLPWCKHGVVSEAKLQNIFQHGKWAGNSFSSWKRALRLPIDKRYFFALNLRDNQEIIPYLFSAIVKACLVLSEGWTSQSCFISIYESGSSDHTRDLILGLDKELEHLRVPHKFVVDGIRRDEKQHRIVFLAKIRNKALAPFYANMSSWDEVVFLNDVAICASGILELLAQKNFHRGDVASGMDYTAAMSHFRTLRGHVALFS